MRFEFSRCGCGSTDTDSGRNAQQSFRSSCSKQSRAETTPNHNENPPAELPGSHHISGCGGAGGVGAAATQAELPFSGEGGGGCKGALFCVPSRSCCGHQTSAITTRCNSIGCAACSILHGVTPALGLGGTGDVEDAGQRSPRWSGRCSRDKALGRAEYHLANVRK